MRLKNKVVIVTGGSRGIGRGIAVRLAEEGARVVINYAKNKKAAQEVKSEIEDAGGRALILKANVSKKEEVDSLIQETVDNFKEINILVNNAGICPFSNFLDISEDQWRKVIDVNLTGAFFCAQGAAREMVRQKKGGRIINVTSISGLKGSAEQVHYCSSKGGENTLTKAMAQALAPYDITVNAVLPGTIETDINRSYMAENSEVRKGVIEETPLRKLGQPKDIAEAVLYFALDQSDWVTGSLLVVDGGFIA